MNLKLSLFVNGGFVDINVDVSDAQAQAWLVNAYATAITHALRRELRKDHTINAQGIVDILTADFDFASLASAAPDEIEEEALALAEADLIAALARDGLPPPKSLRDHAQALITTNDAYLTRAKARLVARAEVVRETLGEAEL